MLLKKYECNDIYFLNKLIYKIINEYKIINFYKIHMFEILFFKFESKTNLLFHCLKMLYIIYNLVILSS